MKALITSNKEMDDIMKLGKPFEESGLLMKGAAKQLNINQKNKMVDFLACY